MKDFDDRVEKGQTLLRKAKATGKLDDFHAIEKLLRPQAGEPLTSLDADELELYLQAQLHIAASVAQGDDPNWTSVLDRVEQVLQFDLGNAHAHWLRGMCFVKLNKEGAIQQLAEALGHAKRMALPETPSWEAEYTRLRDLFQQRQPASSSGSKPSSSPKIVELDNETPLQKGFFNRKNGKSPKIEEIPDDTPLQKGFLNRPNGKKAAQPVKPANGAVGSVPKALEDAVQELRNVMDKWRDDDLATRKAQQSELLALLEERTDRVPEALEGVPLAIESIRREADEFKEIEEKLQEQVSRSNMESIQLKQDVNQVLQDTKRQHSTVIHMKENVEQFLREAKQLITKKQDGKSDAKEEMQTESKVSVVTVDVEAFKQPKVWIAILLSFVAGMLAMLGVVVEVYSAWNCEFTCRR